MIRTLIKLGIFIVIALLGYNYFFGTSEEKEQSRAIVRKAGDLGKDAWNLLRSERTKMKEGKYDDALDNLEGLYARLSTTAEQLRDSDALRRIEELAARRAELERALDRDGELDAGERRELDALTEETEGLMEDMERKDGDGETAPY